MNDHPNRTIASMQFEDGRPRLLSETDVCQTCGKRASVWTTAGFFCKPDYDRWVYGKESVSIPPYPEETRGTRAAREIRRKMQEAKLTAEQKAELTEQAWKLILGSCIDLSPLPESRE